jgi:hypothetical protein
MLMTTIKTSSNLSLLLSSNMFPERSAKFDHTADGLSADGLVTKVDIEETVRMSAEYAAVLRDMSPIIVDPKGAPNYGPDGLPAKLDPAVVEMSNGFINRLRGAGIGRPLEGTDDDSGRVALFDVSGDTPTNDNADGLTQVFYGRPVTPIPNGYGENILAPIPLYTAETPANGHMHNGHANGSMNGEANGKPKKSVSLLGVEQMDTGEL